MGATNLKEGHSRSSKESTVGDFGLLGEVLCAFDGRDHPLDCQESGQVSRVGRDDDEGEEPPHTPHYTGRDGPRIDVGPLLHEGADGKPEGVRQGEDVLKNVVIGVARVWVVPLVGAEAGQDVHHEADDQVGGDDVDPDLDGQGVEKGEEAGALATRALEEDAYAEVHEWLREVDGLFAEETDR